MTRPRWEPTEEERAAIAAEVATWPPATPELVAALRLIIRGAL